MQIITLRRRRAERDIYTDTRGYQGRAAEYGEQLVWTKSEDQSWVVISKGNLV